MSEKKLKRWTKEELSVLLRLYPDHTNAEIARTIGRSEGSVCYMAHIKGLRKHKEWKLMKSSLTCFKKGHVPQNKGKTWDEYMGKEQQEMARKTCYRKGHRPDNLKPVGYERKTVDGYWEVKVAMPNVFKAKHRILWEQHHGPIPEGMCITFIDGNPDKIECRITELAKKLKEFVSATGTVVVLAHQKLDRVSSMNPSVMQELRDTIMESIKNLKADPGTVNQAKQIFQGVNTMINLAKTELEFRKYMDASVSEGKKQRKI